MKKILCLFVTVWMLLSLAACSGGEDASSKKSSDSQEASSSAAGTSGKTTAASSDGIDVDLTKMSSTMVYSEVLNMQQSPESYLGKTVKMKGPFNVTEIGDNRYFACVIADATACCTTGIEFVWAGEHSYPEDYPKENTEITVIGTFNVYMEGSSKYLQLKDAQLEF